MYQHITHKERAIIALMLSRKRSYADIARELGVHRSTISREVWRNRCPDGVYRARVARKHAAHRHQGKQERHKVIENHPNLYEYVVRSLMHRWSPDQISGRLKRDGKLPYVSALTIYTFTERERPDLRVYLRHKKHRRRSEKPFKQSLKRIIDTRPMVVEKRKRVGDWEGDTIVGAEKTERILTHVNRMTGLLVADRTQADSDSVRYATARSMTTVPCKTITYDNGSEFAAFALIEKDTKAKVYFAHPGHPEERPINENTNGLLRQFFPKGSPFATVTQRDVDEAVAMINNRPRKRFGYRTPLEVFFSASVCCT